MLRREIRNSFRNALLAGEPATAAWLTIPWAGAATILGANGVTAAFIDLQHVSHDLSAVEPIILACEVAGVTPLVRPPEAAKTAVTRILDAGAHGLVFPEIETVQEAEAAAAMLRYPPTGTRGWGGAHTGYASWHGGLARSEVLEASDREVPAIHNIGFKEQAENDLSCILIVESVTAVDNIEAIAAVEGIDGIIFGWGDFSVEVNFDKNTCVKAAERVYRVCRENGLGVAVPADASGRDLFYPGCFTIVGADSLMLDMGIERTLQAHRREWLLDSL